MISIPDVWSMIKREEVESEMPSQFVHESLYKRKCRVCEYLISAGKRDKTIHMVPIKCPRMKFCSWIIWGMDSIPDGYE